MRPLRRTVRFTDVGREKRTWTKAFDVIGGKIDLDDICVEVIESGALRSQDVWVSKDPNDQKGVIYAGMHTVGRWEMLWGVRV